VHILDGKILLLHANNAAIDEDRIDLVPDAFVGDLRREFHRVGATELARGRIPERRGVADIG
jgi:hypothetical protein